MTDETWWWIALGLGLVVAVVALVLLEVLYRQVARIEDVAGKIWTAGKQVAGNTANTWQLGTLSEQLDDLTEEAGRHARLLGGNGR